MPQAPTNVLVDNICEAGALLTIFGGGVRPALDGLGDVLNAPREMKLIQHVMGRAFAPRLSQRPRAVGAVAQDSDRRARCRPKVVQHTAQLLYLPIGLGRQTAEDDPFAVVVADLSDENLERPPLIAANRLHMPAVDGERDRSRFGWRSRGRQLHRVSLEPGADMQRPLADRLYLRGVAEREELIQQRASTAVWQQAAHLGEGAFIVRRAAVGQ